MTTVTWMKNRGCHEDIKTRVSYLIEGPIERRRGRREGWI